jgi:biopolymer transport protein ExbD
MSKIKMPVRTPKMDMTPMVDLFCLLLTFFMLTTTFRPQEATQVDTPNSISEQIAVTQDMMTIYVSKDNKVFFNLDAGSDTAMHIRQKVLKDVADYEKVTLTPEQIVRFEQLSSFGMPVADLGKWIDAEGSQRDAMQVGMPMDSVNNELALWIHFTRLANPKVEATIKGDAEANYKTVKKVFDILQEKKINRFNLITNLEKVEIKADELNF